MANNGTTSTVKEQLQDLHYPVEPDVTQMEQINSIRSKRSYENELKWCTWIGSGITGGSVVVSIAFPNPVTIVTAALGTLVSATCGVMNITNELDDKPDEYEQCDASGNIISGSGRVIEGVGINRGSDRLTTAGKVGQGAGAAVKIGCSSVKVIADHQKS